MKFYIASGLVSANDLRHVKMLRKMLEEKFGDQFTYDWTTEGKLTVGVNGMATLSLTAQAEVAGVRDADYVIVYLPGGRGTHFEFGVAYEAVKPIVIFAGHPDVYDECLFYALPGVNVTFTIEGLLSYVNRIRETAAALNR